MMNWQVVTINVITLIVVEVTLTKRSTNLKVVTKIITILVCDLKVVTKVEYVAILK